MPPDVAVAKAGTKISRGANFQCLMSGIAIPGEHIKAEGQAGRLGTRLMAIVAVGDRERVYLAPMREHEALPREAQPEWRPESNLPGDKRSHWTPPYGLRTYGDLFLPRQLVALTAFSDLVTEVRERIRDDAVVAGLPVEPGSLKSTRPSAQTYADAVCTMLAFAVDYAANYWSTIATPAEGFIRGTFARQALPMTWDFAEAHPFGTTSGNWLAGVEWIAKAVGRLPSEGHGDARQADAASQSMSLDRLVSTDPPYYDNIGYADLSDFFYVWLRRSLREVYPTLFATVAVPKAEELVATPYRHGGREKAEAFFLSGMTRAMRSLASQVHSAFPVTIYYAFKQSEQDDDDGVASTGWDTFLDALVSAGFAITGTWPIRTERSARAISIGANALASSIVLACRTRTRDAAIATRRELLASLKSELPAAISHLQRVNIAPVDLAQAAIGPGMAVYTRYSRVLESDGSELRVRAALTLINQVLDEILVEQEGDFDADSRWALAWFEQHGFADGEFGIAETLSKAKNTSVEGLVDAGVLASGGGKVRLLTPQELPEDWDPNTDDRLTVWEMVHHLIRVLEEQGESAAAEIAARLGSKAEAARQLAYRLYTLCERKKRAKEAMSYNGLVQSWPEISQLARSTETASDDQTQLFEE